MHRLLRSLSNSFKWGVAVVLLLAVLETVAMAASPALHAKLHHHDADDRDDDCAVTLFASGAWHDAAPVLAVAPELALAPDDVVVERQRIVRSFRFSGILEHAPPRRA
jgi:hypothetical protein